MNKELAEYMRAQSAERAWKFRQWSASIGFLILLAHQAIVGVDIVSGICTAVLFLLTVTSLAPSKQRTESKIELLRTKHNLDVAQLHSAEQIINGETDALRAIDKTELAAALGAPSAIIDRTGDRWTHVRGKGRSALYQFSTMQRTHAQIDQQWGIREVEYSE